MPSEATARRLGELLAFRHLECHRSTDDLDPDLVWQRLEGALELWPRWLSELEAFDRWLEELTALAQSEGGRDSARPEGKMP